MSIFSSEQAIKPSYIDLLFLSFAITLALLVLVPPSGNIFNSIHTAPRSIDNIHISAPAWGMGESLSFAADQKYWNTHCSQGWSSNARCDTIVARSQACAISVDSAYCSQYKSYLHRYPR